MVARRSGQFDVRGIAAIVLTIGQSRRARRDMALRPRAKKFIVAVLVLLWLPVYALLAMAVGIRVLPHAGPIGQFIYYAVAGMAWIVPIGLMFPWMSREPKG
jgi:hypothetical protein